MTSKDFPPQVKGKVRGEPAAGVDRAFGGAGGLTPNEADVGEVAVLEVPSANELLV